MNTRASHPCTSRTFILSRNHLLFRGLHVVLSDLTTTVMMTGDGDNDYDALEKQQPQLIIVDMASHPSVTELIHKIKQRVLPAPILLLAGMNDLDGLRQASSIGIDGIVLTVQPPAVLLALVGALIHSPRIADSVAASGSSMSPPHLAVGSTALTKRERDIVQLVGQGLSNKEIADRVGIADITVRHHLTSIFDKLGVMSRQKLLIHAHQTGLLRPL